MKISLRRRHAITVADGAFSHKIDYVTIFKILNPEGHPNRITGSKVTAILLNGWIVPIGGASSGINRSSCQELFQKNSLKLKKVFLNFFSFYKRENNNQIYKKKKSYVLFYTARVVVLAQN